MCRRERAAHRGEREQRRAPQDHRAAAEAVGQRAVEQVHDREAEQIGRQRLLHLDRRRADRAGDAGEGRQVGVDRERPEHAQAGEQEGQGPARGRARSCVRRDSSAGPCRQRGGRASDKSVKRADRPDSVRASVLRPRRRDRHSSGPGIAARLGATYPPALRSHSQDAGLFGVAARRDCPFHPAPRLSIRHRLVSVALILTSRWTAVSCYAALCSPDLPRVPFVTAPAAAWLASPPDYRRRRYLVAAPRAADSGPPVPARLECRPRAMSAARSRQPIRQLSRFHDWSRSKCTARRAATHEVPLPINATIRSYPMKTKLALSALAAAIAVFSQGAFAQASAPANRADVKAEAKTAIQGPHRRGRDARSAVDDLGQDARRAQGDDQGRPEVRQDRAGWRSRRP